MLDLPLFFADGHNKYTEVLDAFNAETYALLGPRHWGLFHDEFPTSAFKFTHSQFDNVSAFLDPVTLDVTARVGSLALLTQANELRMFDRVVAKGGRMVMNGPPQTRTWVEHMRANPRTASLNTRENHFAWRAMHPMLYTPVMLNRFGGSVDDIDPKYNHTDEFPDSAAARRVYMQQPCQSITEHLEFGALSLGYDGLFKNVSRSNIYAHMFPITAIEIGKGFVIGLERTITKRSGRFTPPVGAPAVAESSTYIYTNCYAAQAPMQAQSASVSLNLAPGQIAVIVWRSKNAAPVRLAGDQPQSTVP